MSEIVKYQPTAASLPDKMRYAEALACSGMLPSQYRQQPANLLWAMEFADSLGLHPMQAITGVHVIEGKPSASAGLISALVRRAGHKLRVKGDDTHAVAQIVRSDDPGFTFECTWTMARAEQAGLTSKKVWKQYPAAMLKARAITEVAREACEEALCGMHYTPEELGANVDAEGNPVPAEVQQLRRVPAGEPDAWATAAPQQPVAEPGRDYLGEARQATDADTVRQIWQDAKANGAYGSYLDQIAAIGKEKVAAAQPDDTTPDAAVSEVVDGEVVFADAEAEAAEQRLRLAASRAGLADLDAAFEQSYGLPIDAAGTAQLNEMTALIEGAAA